jgi:hypothetical protein
MLDSVRPAEGASDSEIPEDVVAKWDRPLWCNALVRQLKAALNKAEDMGTEKKLVPEALVDLYAMAESEFDPLLEKFGAFCAKHGVDSAPYLDYVRKAAKGKPVLIGKMRTLLQATVAILTGKIGLEPGTFPVTKPAPILVGGPVYRHAEELANAIATKLGLNTL